MNLRRIKVCELKTRLVSAKLQKQSKEYVANIRAIEEKYTNLIKLGANFIRAAQVRGDINASELEQHYNLEKRKSEIKLIISKELELMISEKTEFNRKLSMKLKQLRNVDILKSKLQLISKKLAAKKRAGREILNIQDYLISKFNNELRA